MDATVLTSKTKEILNSNLDISDSNVAFLYAMFSFIENADPEALTICNESFPSYNIKLTGFFINTDENLINIYASLFNENIKDENTNLSLDDFNKIKTGMVNIIELVKNKNASRLNKTSMTYDLCDNISNFYNDYDIIINIVTNLNIPRSYLEKDKNCSIHGTNIVLKVYDQNDLLKIIENYENNNTLTLVDESNHGINAVLISSNKDFDVYLTSFKAKWLAWLYQKDSINLLSANVRSYLKRTNKVNAQIIDTINYFPNEFVAYNNGLSTIATEINFQKINDNFYIINDITNFLIVNGGQTTATLNECKNDQLNLDKVLVPAKLTIIKNDKKLEELISNISIYSNSQTAIKKSDPPSNLKFYKRFEQLSKTILARNNEKEYYCFFERTNGQYNTLKRIYSKKTDTFIKLNPEKNKFTKLQLAQAIVSWEQMPYSVCNGQEKNFELFNSTVKYLKEIDENYFKHSYSLILLYRKLNQLILLNKKLHYKSNLISYTIAFISYKYYKSLNFKEIWNNQDIPSHMCNVLNQLINDVYEKLIESPSSYPDIRMWARKIECWENIKKINKEYDFNFEKETFDFFPQNEEKIYIDKEENLKNPTLWKILCCWNNENDILNLKQKSFISKLPSILYNEETQKKMTKKWWEYAKEIFLLSVQNGFDYKNNIK